MAVANSKADTIAESSREERVYRRTGVGIQSNRKDYIYRLVSFLSPFIVLLLWELMVRIEILNPVFFPSLGKIASSFAAMVTTGRNEIGELVLVGPGAGGELWEHLSISLQRIILGFLLGAIPGTIIGLLMGWSKAVRAFVDPIVAATYPIPKISLLPLLIVIFGLGEMSKVVTVAIAGFFLILISTAHGVMRIDPVLVDAAQNYGATGWKLFIKVILPASLPAIFTGLRLSLGVSLLIIVAAEFVAANRGIGYLIWISWSVLSVGKMYVGLVVIAALGLLFTNGLERLGKALMPWAQDIQERTR
jgi:NitT/TauT family transport system permease protein